MLAGETGQQDRVAEDMRLVNRVCAENHILNVVFNNPVIKEVKKVAIVADLFGEAVCQVTMTFLNFVVRKNRTINLKGISNAYLELFRESKNIVFSQLTTAVDVDEKTLELVKKLVGEYTKKEVELTTKVDGRIIGGAMVEFNNNMYDGRVSSQIAKLRREFNKNLYESEL